MSVASYKVIYSLDIGTDKIVCLIATIKNDKSVFVRGLGHKQSKGIKNGRIVNKKELIDSVYGTIYMAEQMAGKDFYSDNITLNITSSLIDFSIVTGRVEIDDELVKIKHKESIIKIIKDSLDENNKDIVHLILSKYLLDGNIVEDPFEQKAEEFTIEFNLMSINKDILDSYNKIIGDVLKFPSYISNGMANSFALLEENDKEIGTLIIDIGAGSTDISIFCNNKYKFEYSFPIAGDILTKDISSVLKITQKTAEQVKIDNANFLLTNLEEVDQLIKIDDYDSDENWRAAKTTKETINNIVKNRIEELIFMIQKVLREKSLTDMVNSIILTGGTSKIKGIDKFIGDIFNIETKIGYNEIGWTAQNKDYNEILKDPIYSVAIGILNYLAFNDGKIQTNDSLVYKFIKYLFS